MEKLNIPRNPRTEKITTMSEGLFIANSVIDIYIISEKNVNYFLKKLEKG